jgi:hypothetical protein
LRLLLPTDADVSGFGKMIGYVCFIVLENMCFLASLNLSDLALSVTKVLIENRQLPSAKPGKDMLQALMEAGLTRDELAQESIVQM